MSGTESAAAVVDTGAAAGGAAETAAKSDAGQDKEAKVAVVNDEKAGTALSTGKTGTDEAKADDAATAGTKSVVPEKYDIKAPEGVTLDQSAVDAFTESVARKAGLTNEQAQAVIEFGAKRQADLEAASTKAQTEQIAKEEKSDLDALRKDPELGGANYEQTLKDAQQAFLKFATKDEIEFIDATRLGNRVPMIKLFHRIFQAFKEDTGRRGGEGGGPLTEEQLLALQYPTMVEKEEE